MTSVRKPQTMKHYVLSLLLFIALTLSSISFLTNTDLIIAQEAESPETDAPSTTQVLPVIPTSAPLWNHKVMNIDKAWEEGYTGKGVRIAILDTGFDIQHPDLRMAGGNSVFADDPWSNDHSGHGTHVAGIIGATAGSAYQGIAPDAELYGIKIYHEDNIDEHGFVSTNVESVINGIQLAMDFDVNIIMISSGLTYNDEALHRKIIEAHQRGILIIAASGNGSMEVNYPASYPEVIAVTAVDERLHPALDIIYGQANEFAAPGVNIGGLSIPDSPYSYPYIIMSGSSQAVPHVAGLAAILMEKHGGQGESIRQIMRESAQNLGDPGFYGYGLVRYTSNNVNNTPPPEQETPPEVEEEGTPSDNTDPDDLEEVISEEEQIVQKPVSSRAPDEPEDEEISETTAHYYTDAIEQGDHGALALDIIPLIENGGILEIDMGTFNSIYLSERQVNAVRERNIRLILAKENASWTIPPANLLPGNALLRFYEGAPVGLIQRDGAVSTSYTTSIYQRETNRSVYPSQMQIKIDMSHLTDENLEKFHGFIWDKEKEEWFEPITEIVEDSMVLITRHTSTMGIYDTEKVPEEVQNPDSDIDDFEQEEAEGNSTFLGIIVAGGVIFIVGLIIIRQLLKKRKEV